MLARPSGGAKGIVGTNSRGALRGQVILRYTAVEAYRIVYMHANRTWRSVATIRSKCNGRPLWGREGEANAVRKFLLFFQNRHVVRFYKNQKASLHALARVPPVPAARLGSLNTYCNVIDSINATIKNSFGRPLAAGEAAGLAVLRRPMQGHDPWSEARGGAACLGCGSGHGGASKRPAAPSSVLSDWHARHSETFVIRLGRRLMACTPVALHDEGMPLLAMLRPIGCSHAPPNTHIDEAHPAKIPCCVGKGEHNPWLQSHCASLPFRAHACCFARALCVPPRKEKEQHTGALVAS